ncbi:MAG: thymidine phosphorylase [Chloroflexota bacterium]|nr:thymidine phosphorylase [Chloroflexota bacterium]
MRMIDLIAKKRDRDALTDAEIDWLITHYVAGDVPDYQMAAFVMAVYLNGMTRAEIVHLTLAMARSGDQLDLSAISDYWVDKHSSGGVGDKTSLIVLPLVAACDVPVAKMSGRGLGMTGGTIDKLEAIPGFRVDLSADEFKRQAKEQGIVLSGQSLALAPADGKIYALRDSIGAVASKPLIASSIMSKKIAAGANGIVLDVKVGGGAFMPTLEDGRELARLMVEIGADAGRDVIAVLSDMNQPLGVAVGHALEVKESIAMLSGEGAHDLREHCLAIAGHMLTLAGRGSRWTDAAEVRALLESKLADGSARAKLRQLVGAQGGDVTTIDDPSKLPASKLRADFTALRAGIVQQVNANAIAHAAFELGAGREKKGDRINLAVGLEVHVKVADRVEAGAPLFTLHFDDEGKRAACENWLNNAVTIGDASIEPLPLFYDVIRGSRATSPAPAPSASGRVDA